MTMTLRVKMAFVKAGILPVRSRSFDDVDWDRFANPESWSCWKGMSWGFPRRNEQASHDPENMITIFPGVGPVAVAKIMHHA